MTHTFTWRCCLTADKTYYRFVHIFFNPLCRFFFCGTTTASEKIKTLNDCGVETADTPSEIGTTLIDAAKKAGIYEELLTIKK
jgi:hypothetical protein